LEEVSRRGVRLIANRRNQGFAAAANQGFAALNTPYILLLNPDAVVVAGLAEMQLACRIPGAAGAGGRLLGDDGNPQVGFMVRGLPSPLTLILEVLLLNRIWPGNAENRRYRGLDLNYNSRITVEQPAGAFLMIRRQVWEELGGFDEAFYPLWFEDVDFCRRARDKGYAFYYEPKATAKHTGAHSISKSPKQMQRIYWYGNLLRYAAKHFRPATFRMVCLAVLVGSVVRVFAESASQWSIDPVAAYRNVLRLASRCFLFGWRDEVVLSGPLS
jgi:GT2 family glycosyltransferase